MRYTACLVIPAFALVVACTDDSPGEETSTTATESGDGDGDPTGDGDGDPTGDGDGDPTGDGDGDPTGDGDGDPVAECMSVEDCELVDDCCTCDVVPDGQAPPCDLQECFAPTCEVEFGGGPEQYYPEAACFMGACVIEALNCNPDDVFCDIIPPPPCVDGKVRSVIANCYGPCVRPSMCETLPQEECGPDTCGEGFTCMISQAGGLSRCVPVVASCGEPSCECIAPWLDEACPSSCAEAGGVLICEDGG